MFRFNYFFWIGLVFIISVGFEIPVEGHESSNPIPGWC